MVSYSLVNLIDDDRTPTALRKSGHCIPFNAEMDGFDFLSRVGRHEIALVLHSWTSETSPETKNREPESFTHPIHFWIHLSLGPISPQLFNFLFWSSQRSHPQYTWEWPAESVARVQAANDVNRSKSQVSQIDVRCIQISKCHKQVSQQIFGSPADYAWIFLADKLSWAGMVTRGKAYLAGCRMQLDTQPARNENSKTRLLPMSSTSSVLSELPGCHGWSRFPFPTDPLKRNDRSDRRGCERIIMN